MLLEGVPEVTVDKRLVLRLDRLLEERVALLLELLRTLEWVLLEGVPEVTVDLTLMELLDETVDLRLERLLEDTVE